MARRALRVVWAPLAVVGLHAALVLTIGHYRSLDPVFHLLGGAAGAYALIQLFTEFPGFIRLPASWEPRTTAVIATFAVAILWECVEWVSDTYFGGHSQQGALDTGSDLALGALGAIGAAW